MITCLPVVRLLFCHFRAWIKTNCFVTIHYLTRGWIFRDVLTGVFPWLCISHRTDLGQGSISYLVNKYRIWPNEISPVQKIGEGGSKNERKFLIEGMECRQSAFICDFYFVLNFIRCIMFTRNFTILLYTLQSSILIQTIIIYIIYINMHLEMS